MHGLLELFGKFNCINLKKNIDLIDDNFPRTQFFRGIFRAFYTNLKPNKMFSIRKESCKWIHCLSMPKKTKVNQTLLSWVVFFSTWSVYENDRGNIFSFKISSRVAWLSLVFGVSGLICEYFTAEKIVYSVHNLMPSCPIEMYCNGQKSYDFLFI